MKTQIKSPKLVIIGAGSIFFTRAVAIGMCKDPCFKNGVLSLVDINPDILDVMKRLCQRIIRETGANLTLEATTNRRVALKNAQFVTLSFSNRGVDLREIETKIPAAFGVRQSSGDTIGPGGLFRSIRTIPTVLEIARDIEKICPEAWVFNYVNPTTVIGAALFRHTRLKTLALCDGFRLPDSKLALLDRVGVARAKAGKVTMKIGGLNHFLLPGDDNRSDQMRHGVHAMELLVNGLLAEMVQDTTGAACIFTGVVRGFTQRGDFHQTSSLIYEAYIPMAEDKMEQVAQEIRMRWPDVEGIGIIQRIGHLETGTPSVAIACTSSHRDCGIFEAARYGIDRLKEIVPVWKKEIGPQGETWIEGKYLPGPGD